MMLYYSSKTTSHLLQPYLKCSKALLILLHFSTTSSSSSSSSPPKPHNNPLILNHLITTFGFTQQKAISISTTFPLSTSPHTLSSVPHFLKHLGFTDTHIKNLISRRPRFLFAKIDKTLHPKIKLLQELGFSGSSLADLIIKNPNILIRDVNRFLIPTTTFLKSFLCSNDNVFKVVKKCNWLLSYDFKDNIATNVDTLRQCGVCNERIARFFIKFPRFFTQKPDWVEELVARVEEFGVKKDSGLFIYAVYALSSMSKDTIKEKFELYKSYGWSESDILYAFRKAPNFIMNSEQKVREIMDFVTEDLGYDPRVVSLRPKLLSYSLEKRLKPRNEVLKILNSKKGLFKKKLDLVRVLNTSDKKFMENYVVKFVGKVPRLKEAYNCSNIQ